MQKPDICKYALESNILKRWHYLSYHFSFYLTGETHAFVEALFDALLGVDRVAPGYAKTMIDRIASIGGREKHDADYEQLLQLFAEIHVVAHLASEYRAAGYRIEIEPGASKGLPNPEITIESDTWILAVEVKAPALLQLRSKRRDMDIQLLGRFDDNIRDLLTPIDHTVMLPRDNTIRDFLSSANHKFEVLPVPEDKTRYNLLVIVWDDAIQEAVAALLSPESGLLTKQSFAKDADDCFIKYGSTHAVILIRHLHQLVNAMGDENLFDEALHAFDYGSYDSFPWKALIANPFVENKCPPEIVGAMQATAIEGLQLAAEYIPLDVIRWGYVD